MTDEKLAKQWRCTSRTIRQWRRDGAPLHDRRGMLAFLAGRRQLPPGTRALLESESAVSLPTPAPQSIDQAVTTRTGAASALRRLETAEETTYGLLQSALKSGSALAIKTARENWLAIGNQLRQYDRLVEQDRRDSGELIPRADVERHVARFIQAFRIAGKVCSHTLARQLSGCDVAAVDKLLTEQHSENVLTMLATLSSAPNKARLPDWWIKAANEGLTGEFCEPGDIVNERREAFEAAFEILVRRMIEVTEAASDPLTSQITNPK